MPIEEYNSFISNLIIEYKKLSETDLLNLDLDIKNELNLLENKRNNYELINLNSAIDNLRLNIKDNTIINDDQKNDLISQLESI